MSAADHDNSTTSGFGHGMLLLALANAAYIVTAYVVTTATARILAPDAFGEFGVVTAWVTLLTALLVKGLATTTAREMAAGAVDAATAWRAGRSLGVRLSVGCAVLGAAASPVGAHLLGSSDLAAELAVGSLAALTFGINAVLLAWPTGMRQYGRQAVAQVAYAVARLVLVVGGAAAFGLAGAVVGYVLAPLLSSVVLVGRRPPATGDVAPVRARMQRAVVPIALASVATAAYFVVDVFALSAAVGDDSAQVGIYVAYGTLAHVPFFLLQAASVVLVPALAAARAGAARRAAVRRTTTDTLVLLAGPTLLLCTAGDAAARIVFGAEYHTSASIVLPLALATAAVTMLTNLVAVDVAIGRLRRSLVVSGIGVLVLGAACTWAADADPGAAARDVAWAACAASVLVTAAMAVEVRSRHGALLDVRRAGGGLAVAAVAALPPLLFAGDVVRVAVAGVCSLAWLAAVVLSGLVDVRRSPTVVAGLEHPVDA